MLIYRHGDILCYYIILILIHFIIYFYGAGDSHVIPSEFADAFLAEQTRALAEKRAAMALVFPDASNTTRHVFNKPKGGKGA